MIRHGWSLRWLIGGVYFLIVSITLGALALYLLHLTEQDTMKRQRDSLKAQLRLCGDMIGRLAHNGEEAHAVEQRIFSSSNAIHWMVRSVSLITATGNVITQEPLNTTSLGTAQITPEIGQALESAGGEGEDLRYDEDSGDRVLYLARKIRFISVTGGLKGTNGQLSYTTPFVNATADHPKIPAASHAVSEAVLVFAAPTTDVEDSLKNVRSAVWIAFFCAITVLLLIHLVVTSYIVHPLENLTMVAERFAAGNLHERVRPAGALEISSLGTSFNHMAGQLRGTIGRLAEERAQAQAILVSMADGVLVTDLQGVLLLINRRAEEICGIDAGAAIGKTLTEMLLHYEMDDMLSKTLSSGLPLQHEMMFKHPVSRVVEVHMAPVDAEGRRFGAVITLYDITPRRKLEQMRRDFVANVSHELRTPVSSIRAMSEALLDGGINEPEMAEEFLQTIVGESERLTALLDDLLQLSRIESGERQLKSMPLDLSALIRHVADRVITPIKAKGQQLMLDLPEHLMVNADHDALTQVVLNLLDNARKYSPERSTITVKLEQDDMISLRMIDTGYGIPKEDLTRIFERFYRVDKARSRAEGGTGLGLAIVKHLVEQQGGRIFVTSELGVGSQFTVVLPRAEPAASGKAEEPPAG